MNISKKEIYIFIDIVFSIMFAIIYLPFFYKNSINLLTNSEAISKVIQVIIFSGVYFSVTYGLLQLLFKEKIIKDERDYFRAESLRLNDINKSLKEKFDHIKSKNEILI